MSTFFTPEIVLVIVALVLLLVDAFLPRLPKRILGYAGAVGIAIAFLQVSHNAEDLRTGAIINTHPFWATFTNLSWYVLASKMIILSASFLTLIMMSESRSMISRFVTGDSRNSDGTGELFILPLIATAGMMWMCSATDFISLFVALELTTLSFYIMVGFLRRNVGSLEGGIKYLITGAMSAGIMVLGIAWLYGTTGTFSLSGGLQMALTANPVTSGTLFALALIFLGLIFKIGAVPMHVWVPDVYQGAPTPITAFLSVASKTAGLCVLFTFIMLIYPVIQVIPGFMVVLLLVTAATIVIGNMGAIGQTNVKRLLGYSSIAHAGFILPFFIIGARDADEYYIFYLMAYLPMTFGAFFIVSLIRNQIGREDLSAFRGLGKRNPRLAAVTTLMFASLAGVPLTGGFVAKYYSFSAMVAGASVRDSIGLWIILGLSVVAAAAGFYYYFKPIRAMYWEDAEEGTPTIRVSPLAGVVLALLSISVIYLGVCKFIP